VQNKKQVRIPPFLQCALSTTEKLFLRKSKAKIMTGTSPLTIFGTVVVAVFLILVPNCSAAKVTNIAQ
jgi:hypothetical protein